MEERLNEFSQRLTDVCAELGGPILDMGCAYGVASLAALERGAEVVACDMDSRHLDILRRRTPRKHRSRLITVTGTLPFVDFESNSFAAIHCSRCLHFLRPDDLRLSLSKMHRWLRPGGRVYFLATTCYAKPWSLKLDDFERKSAAGDPWPGLIEDVLSCLPIDELEEGMPPFINTLDPETLARECTLAGYRVIEARFLDVAHFSSESRDHAAVLAERRA